MEEEDQIIDVHINLPQSFQTASYAVPTLLALITVCWDREALEGTASVGDLNAMGILSFGERLRPNFLQSLRSHGLRKVILPRGPALELVRQGGGFGDRWTLRNGVVVEGAEGVLDLIRCAYLDDF